MCDMGDTLLNYIKRMYANSLAYARVKEDDIEYLIFESGVRLGCIMYSCLFNEYIDGVMKEVKTELKRELDF